MTPERTQKFKRVAAARQPSLTVILENVHDQHNIGAVLRSCDSVGVMDIFILYTEPDLVVKNIEIGRRTSMGTQKWLNVHYYTDPAACFAHVRQHADLILGTKLTADSQDLYQLDLTQRVALMFGNERDGLSEAIAPYIDGNFTIPQVGMAESLNISVACAVTLYEAYRQRAVKGFYTSNPAMEASKQQALFEELLERHESGDNREVILPTS
jgi:tRNA (guanosine-2'-O-)-methyltransferase